jgi:hypothetical protein
MVRVKYRLMSVMQIRLKTLPQKSNHSARKAFRLVPLQRVRGIGQDFNPVVLQGTEVLRYHVWRKQ